MNVLLVAILVLDLRHILSIPNVLSCKTQDNFRIFLLNEQQARTKNINLLSKLNLFVVVSTGIYRSNASG
jgi:hypothetical protein